MNRIETKMILKRGVGTAAVVTMALLLMAARGCEPVFTWEPGVVRETSARGEVRTIEVTLTAYGAVENASLAISSDIASYVSVLPASGITLAAEQQLPVLITAEIPLNATFRRIRGELSVQDDTGSTYLTSLPITLTVARRTIASPSGVLMTYPSEFTSFDNLNDMVDTVTLTTFGDEYDPGGLIPMGGADVVVRDLPPVSGTIDDYLQPLHVDDTIESTETILLDDMVATRIEYTRSFSAVFSMKYVDVYVSWPDALHKISLAYNPGDPSETEFLSALQSMLDSIELPN